MRTISKHCLMALEGGVEQTLLRHLKYRATWKVARNERGRQYARLDECTIGSRKRDWQNGAMVSLTVTFKDNKVADMYGVLTWATGEMEPYEPLAKEDLVRRLNALVDVEVRRKGWELFTGCHGVALNGIRK